MCKLLDTNYKLTRSVLNIVLAMIFLLSFHILNFLRLSSPLRQRKINLTLPGCPFSNSLPPTDTRGYSRLYVQLLDLNILRFNLHPGNLPCCEFAMHKVSLIKRAQPLEGRKLSKEF